MAEGRSGGEDARLSQHLVAVPPSQIFRPARNTAKPLVSGVQRATVVATPPDAYGRVRVRFHWQRSRGARAQSTAWLRMVQPLVSPGAALHGLLRPRPSQAVLVLFDEGDPTVRSPPASSTTTSSAARRAGRGARPRPSRRDSARAPPLRLASLGAPGPKDHRAGRGYDLAVVRHEPIVNLTHAQRRGDGPWRPAGCTTSLD